MEHDSPSCPVCSEKLEVMICPKCNTIQHKDCYEFTKRCATYGCDGKASEVDITCTDIVPNKTNLPVEQGGLETSLAVPENVQLAQAVARANSYPLKQTLWGQIAGFLCGKYPSVKKVKENEGIYGRYHAQIDCVDSLTDARAVKHARFATITEYRFQEQVTHAFSTITYCGKKYENELENKELIALTSNLYQAAIHDFIIADRPLDAIDIALEFGNNQLAKRIAFVAANQALEDKIPAHIFHQKLGDYENTIKYLALYHKTKGIPIKTAHQLQDQFSHDLYEVMIKSHGFDDLEDKSKLDLANLTEMLYCQHVEEPFMVMQDMYRFRLNTARRITKSLISSHKYHEALKMAQDYRLEKEQIILEGLCQSEDDSKNRLARGMKMLQGLKSEKGE